MSHEELPQSSPEPVETPRERTMAEIYEENCARLLAELPLRINALSPDDLKKMMDIAGIEKVQED